MTQTQKHNAVLYIAPTPLPDGLYLGPRAEDHVDTYQATDAWRLVRLSDGPVSTYILPADSEFVPAPEDLPDGYETIPLTVSQETLRELHSLIYTHPGHGGVPSPVHMAYNNAMAMLMDHEALSVPVVDRLIRAAARCGHTPERKAAMNMAIVVGAETVTRALAEEGHRVQTRADAAALAVMPPPKSGAVAVKQAAEQFAALAELHTWSAVVGRRREYVLAAWEAGIHNVRRIALSAGLSRGTVYGDLKAAGIDPAGR